MIQRNASKNDPYTSELFRSSINVLTLVTAYSKMILIMLASLHLYQCPACHGHKLKRNTEYERSVLDFRNGKVVSTVLSVTVLYCPECKTYHAVLPAFLCPQRSYTYRFMFHVYKYRVLEKHSLGQCSRKFDICEDTVKSICKEIEDIGIYLAALDPKQLIFINSDVSETLTIPIQCSQIAQLLTRSSEEDFYDFICSATYDLNYPLITFFMMELNHDLSYIINTFKEYQLGLKLHRYWSLV